jgi:hypothetical protein
LEGQSRSEFEKFDDKEFTKPQHLEELKLIYSTIRTISRRGAKERFFRFEERAFALPGRVEEEHMDANPDDFGIRVYCGILAMDVVLLLGGDIKTKRSAKDCPNVKPHFELAQRIMRAFNKAMEDGFIRIVDGRVEMDSDYELEI